MKRFIILLLLTFLLFAIKTGSKPHRYPTSDSKFVMTTTGDSIFLAPADTLTSFMKSNLDTLTNDSLYITGEMFVEDSLHFNGGGIVYGGAGDYLEFYARNEGFWFGNKGYFNGYVNFLDDVKFSDSLQIGSLSYLYQGVADNGKTALFIDNNEIHLKAYTYIEDTLDANQINCSGIVNSGYSYGRETLKYRSLVNTDTVNGNYEVYMSGSQTDTMFVTLLSPQDIFPEDNRIHKIRIYKANYDNYPIIVQTLDTDSFPQGNKKVVLHNAGEFIDVGGVNYTGISWRNISPIEVNNVIHRSETWDYTNFSTDTAAVPFSHNDFCDNDEIFSWSSADSTKLYCNVTTTIYVSYVLDFNSTSGLVEWDAESYITKNGEDIEQSHRYTGSAKAKDNGVSLPPIPIRVSKGDYIELNVHSVDFIGNINNALLITRCKL